MTRIDSTRARSAAPGPALSAAAAVTSSIIASGSVAAAAEHVREVAVQVPQVWPRTFTLREIVRRGEEVGRRGADQPLDEWVAKLHAGRTPAMLVGASDTDDVADPMGRGRRSYDTAATDIE